MHEREKYYYENGSFYEFCMYNNSFYEDLTPTEVIEAQKRADAKRSAEEAASKIREERELEERKRERERKMMEWTELLEKLQEEEEEKFCIMGQPLRHYLVRYVFPTLTKGLIEVAKLRPEDPVDFLNFHRYRERLRIRYYHQTTGINGQVERINKNRM
ncbi:adenylate kinase 7-like isoform X2 [Vespa crabro]|uniref:adenylate kinase 7-like isoform X2 n=1 Tax=Vespa crabro TaxID=7445 RepID=UPI001F020161|nr:adenylate kinase 7-like isoform X2 [Vespa crabro]